MVVSQGSGLKIYGSPGKYFTGSEARGEPKEALVKYSARSCNLAGSQPSGILDLFIIFLVFSGWISVEPTKSQSGFSFACFRQAGELTGQHAGHQRFINFSRGVRKKKDRPATNRWHVSFLNRGGGRRFAGAAPHGAGGAKCGDLRCWGRCLI